MSKRRRNPKRSATAPRQETKKPRSPPTTETDTRICRRRIVCEQFVLDFGYPAASESTLVPVMLSKPTSDIIHYRLDFDPPLRKLYATQSIIRLGHKGSQQTNIRIVVLPAGTASSIDEEHGFMVYATHAVRLDPLKADIMCLYLSIQNVQLRGDQDHAPIYTLMVAPQHERYQSLAWQPPDPQYYDDMGISVDSRLVAQSTPMWFKNRGKLTGSGLSKHLGFFAPKLGTADAETFEFHAKAVFTGWKAVNLRFGHLKEANAMLSVLEACPQLEFTECGYFPHPDRPHTWGASPDGLLYDPTAPAAMPTQWSADAFAGITLEPLEYGVCEIKSSRFTSSFSGYHIPQCMWEMICTNRAWCDLIRYCERRVMNAETRKWETGYECKKIRIFRDAETEKRLYALLHQSLDLVNKGGSTLNADYLKLVHSPPFAEMRAHFEAVAKQATAAATIIPVAHAEIKRQAELQEQLVQHQAEYVPSIHPAIDRIDDQFPHMVAAYQDATPQDNAEFLRLALTQIDDYVTLIKSIL